MCLPCGREMDHQSLLCWVETVMQSLERLHADVERLEAQDVHWRMDIEALNARIESMAAAHARYKRGET